MTEFSLMPKSIYVSLKLWDLSKCGIHITLADNSIKTSLGVAEGIFTKIMGATVSIDYHVIECVGEGHITLGRSLLKLFRAFIDMNKGTLRLYTPLKSRHIFPQLESKKKSKRAKAKSVDFSTLDNT